MLATKVIKEVRKQLENFGLRKGGENYGYEMDTKAGLLHVSIDFSKQILSVNAKFQDLDLAKNHASVLNTLNFNEHSGKYNLCVYVRNDDELFQTQSVLDMMYANIALVDLAASNVKG